MPKFAAEYPDLFKALANGKIIDINNVSKTDAPRISIREDVFRKLENLWKLINQKYYLHFDKTDDGELKQAIADILAKNIDGRTTVTTKNFENLKK